MMLAFSKLEVPLWPILPRHPPRALSRLLHLLHLLHPLHLLHLLLPPLLLFRPVELADAAQATQRSIHSAARPTSAALPSSELFLVRTRVHAYHENTKDSRVIYKSHVIHVGLSDCLLATPSSMSCLCECALFLRHANSLWNAFKPFSPCPGCCDDPTISAPPFFDECTLSEYSEFTPCSQSCGSGVAGRTKTFISGPSLGSTSSYDCLPLSDYQSCNLGPCEDGQCSTYLNFTVDSLLYPTVELTEVGWLACLYSKRCSQSKLDSGNWQAVIILKLLQQKIVTVIPLSQDPDSEFHFNTLPATQLAFRPFFKNTADSAIYLKDIEIFIHHSLYTLDFLNNWIVSDPEEFMVQCWYVHMFTSEATFFF